MVDNSKQEKYVGPKFPARGGGFGQRNVSDSPAFGGTYPTYDIMSEGQLKITEIKCKNALVRSGIYGVDYALNPYTGCQFVGQPSPAISGGGLQF